MGSEVTMQDGLKYTDEQIGTGAVAMAGKTAVVHYTGWLMDGTKFDSSVDRKQPFSFSIGAGQVIKGWAEGVAGRKGGGRCSAAKIPAQTTSCPIGGPRTTRKRRLKKHCRPYCWKKAQV